MTSGSTSTGCRCGTRRQSARSGTRDRRGGLIRSTRRTSPRTGDLRRQVHSKASRRHDESGRHIGYLTQVLTKSVGEVVEQSTDSTRPRGSAPSEPTSHGGSSRWPRSAPYRRPAEGARSNTNPGTAGKGAQEAHSAAWAAGAGARKWSGNAGRTTGGRKAFVAEALAVIGIESRVKDTVGSVGTRSARDPTPPRAHLLCTPF